jgi:hypothetical protein
MVEEMAGNSLVHGNRVQKTDPVTLLLEGPFVKFLFAGFTGDKR